ncbi:MAG: NUDIX domain-containing protein [Symploca sp. SIO2E6]|nr:NUDIX domain-containing protein [Symploca sp. SIO2E6]
MAKLVQGERIGKLGKVVLGCSAIVFDAAKQKVLLTQRTDNGRWCLPGGRIDPGESAAEACTREVLEETGLEVNVERLVGVYSDPNYLIEYADGERCHVFALHFEVQEIGGTLGLSNETTAYGYFSQDEIADIDLMEHHWQRIKDSFAEQMMAFVR